MRYFKSAVLFFPLAALFAGSLGCAGPAAEPAGGYNLILVSIDTLRADHLGCYGYERPTSPAIDAFARRSVLFENAFSQSPKTTPSHMTLFTSQYPTVHGVFMYLGEPDAKPFRIDAKTKTLADRLGQQGYYSAAFAGGGHMSRAYGFDQGFDGRYFVDLDWSRGFEWIRAHRQEKLFVFLHTYAVHDPYQPPEPYYSLFNPGYRGAIRPVRGGDWRSQHEQYWLHVDPNDPADARQLEALYDGAIRHMDEKLFAPLLDLLDELALRDRTIVVLTSDHGEEFKEHGRFLHDQIYDETLHVPLLVYLPGPLAAKLKPRSRVSAEVGLIDLMPTLLDLVGAPIEGDDIQGASLRPYIEGRARADRPVYACNVFGDMGPPAILTEQALRDGRFKLLEKRHRQGSGFELFDIVSDPGEQTNRADIEAGIFTELRRQLDRVDRENQALRDRLGLQPLGSAFDEADRRRLRALGYLR